MHGFVPQHLLAPRGQIDENDLRQEALVQAGIMSPYFDEYIVYPSFERVSGGIATSVYNQVKELETRGICSNGCFVVTLSTGDLVARYMMSRLNAWGINANKFRVLATLDLVGAGSGTELADTGVNVITSDNLFSSVTRLALSAWLGDDFTGIQPSGLDVVNDLRPSMARSLATTNLSIPRLKVAGGGKISPLVDVTGPFISGGDDGVIPLHSACGARYKESIYSCANNIRIDGRVASADGPSWGFLYNQFPVLMPENLGHLDSNDPEPVGKLVAISSNVNKNFAGLSLSVNEQTRTTGRWLWKKTYREVNYNQSTPIGQFIFDSLND